MPKEDTEVDSSNPSQHELLQDLRGLIQDSRQAVSTAVNSALVWLYWKIGKRILVDVLQSKRAEYGSQVVTTLATELQGEYGKGFGKRNLFRMLRFAEVFPEKEIVSALMTQLGWTHFIYIIALEDELKRNFYAEMCRVERWSTRTLQKKINGMLFERTALSRKPEELAKQELAELQQSGQLSPDLVFRDPYFLDFLGLKDTYSEKDLETAILKELESFILEMGRGFAFVARQFRLVIDGEDHYIDLLFYHRILQRLIAVDLKLGKFKAADKGQMELYLRWLEKHEQEPGEQSPLGMILCADKSDEKVELLKLSETGIHVAQYLTELPPLELLKRKLHESVDKAKSTLSTRNSETDGPK